MGGEDFGKGRLAEQGSHICVQINWKEQLGSETDRATQGTSMGEIKPQNL